MDFHLSKVESLLFALLRLGFKNDISSAKVAGASFENLTAGDWMACYRLACAQGVMALAWDGVQALPKEKQPPLGVKVPWALAVEEYEKRYQRYCNTIEELTQFYGQHGIATVQMKGVGLSSYYPVPEHREGGDIDIYTFAKRDQSRKSHETADLKSAGESAGEVAGEVTGEVAGESAGKVAGEVAGEYAGKVAGKTAGKVAEEVAAEDRRANELADELMRRQGAEVEMHSYKHSNFFYKGIPIENHKCFLNVKHYRYGVQADDFLKRNLNPQEVLLKGCKNSILIPSLAFNSVFVPFHAFQHYGTGISLHHLCDWYVILQKGAMKSWPKEINDKSFINAIAAFSILSDSLLGSDSGFAEEKKAEALAQKMLQEMLHPKFDKNVPAKGRMAVLIYKTRRFLHRYCLLKEVFEISLVQDIWKSIIAHIRQPETIFR